MRPLIAVLFYLSWPAFVPPLELCTSGAPPLSRVSVASYMLYTVASKEPRLRFSLGVFLAFLFFMAAQPIRLWST